MDLYKNFLRHILCIFCILHYADGCIENPVLVIIYQIFKRRFITIAETLYQLNFIQQLEGLKFDVATYENMLFVNTKRQ